MSHHAAKLPACANCHYAFVPGEPDEFCPRCGQQNHAVRIGFGHVAEEFLEGVFHFDGKVFRTLRLLLFRPGELTRRFLAGHRVPYVPPIRLYVFISFVFFFLLSLNSQPEGGAVRVRVGPVPVQPQGGNITIGPRLPFTKAQFDSLPEHLTRTQADSVLRRHHRPATFLARVMVQHLPRLMRLSPEEIRHQVLKSFSIMLFVLMPLAALLLQAAYWHQRRYYLSHLIFSVHLHCFVFALLLLLLGLAYLPIPENTSLVLTLLIPLYLLLALRRLYGQSWGTTALKGALVLAGYGVLLTGGLLAALGLGLSLL
ncbi:hypothetical protein A0257_22515 (plasmid) [Hymenobacter psoromatis]|nr:hypothetical protein A0257_22515 [Hymenobacter psoromatis]